jgi:uncharacterized protein
VRRVTSRGAALSTAGFPEVGEQVITDLVQIRRLGEAKAAENTAFRRYLSVHHHRMEELQAIATGIQQQTDCTACGNCCRYSVVSVNREEIRAIAAHLNVAITQVRQLYTAPDPESQQRILKSGAEGCVFLDSTGLCTIYTARPRTCREFPHLAIGSHTLGARLSSLCRWASLCPIIYNAIEEYKHRRGFPRP